MDNFPEVPGGRSHPVIPYLAQDHPVCEYDGGTLQDFPERAGLDRKLLDMNDYVQCRSVQQYSALVQSYAFIAPLALFFALGTQNAAPPIVLYNIDGPRVLLSPCFLGRFRSAFGYQRLHEHFLTAGFLCRQKDDVSGRERLSLSLKPLSTYTDKLRQKLAAMTDDDMCRELEERHSLLQELNSILNLFLDLGKRDTGRPILDDELHLSLTNLAWSLNTIWLGLSKERDSVNKRLYVLSGTATPPATSDEVWAYLKRRLLDAGLCPYDIHQSLLSWSVRLAYFASCLPCTDTQDHTNCTTRTCIRTSVKETEYRVRHVSPGCDCAQVDITNDMTAFYEHEQRNSCEEEFTPTWPIVLIDPNTESTSLSLKVIPSREYCYVAISHVWSDGLGNPRSNSLPTCQIQRIQRICNECVQRHTHSQHPMHVAFWMDTLCVPLSPILRRSAILQMADIYEKAEVTLVLDTGLQQLTLDTDIEILCLRFATARWFRRLWTLQEGVFAKTGLYLQVQDGGIDRREFIALRSGLPTRWTGQHKRGSSELFLKWPLASDAVVEFLPALEGIELNRILRPSRWSWQIWHAVQDRATSKSEDVTTCVSSLLMFQKSSRATLLKIPDARSRQLAFFRSPDLEEVPLALLLNNWPKLDAEGLRWAPATFSKADVDDTEVARMTVSPNGPTARILPHGLLVRATAYRFDKTSLPLHAPLIVRLDRLPQHQIGEDVKGPFWLTIDDCRSSVDKQKVPWLELLTPVAPTSLHAPSTTQELTFLLFQNPSVGALCGGVMGAQPANYPETQPYNLLRYKAVIMVALMNPSLSDYLGSKLAADEQDLGRYLAEGRRVRKFMRAWQKHPPHAQWVVG